jgi:hypothetical protein
MSREQRQEIGRLGGAAKAAAMQQRLDDYLAAQRAKVEADAEQMRRAEQITAAYNRLKSRQPEPEDRSWTIPTVRTEGC